MKTVVFHKDESRARENLVCQCQVAALVEILQIWQLLYMYRLV